MTSRRLLILAALAIAAIAAALLISRQQTTTAGADRNRALYPDLKSKLDSVDAIRVFKAADTRVMEVKRDGTQWSMTDRDGYPADAARIRKLLIAIADARLVEEKTSNPANYPALGVEDVSAATAAGHRIEISGGAPVNLIVGKAANGARARYVRRVSEPQSWQISDSLDVPTTIDSWLRKEVIDVPAERVQSFRITIGAGKPWSAAKSARTDTVFAVDGLPKGKALSSPDAANTTGSALTAITLADVHKAQSLQGDKPAAHATFRTFDGLIAELDGWIRDGKHVITIATSYDASQVQRFKSAVPETSAAASSPSPPAPDVAAEAKAYDDQSGGWAYEIPEYKYDAIFKPLDELLKK